MTSLTSWVVNVKTPRKQIVPIRAWPMMSMQSIKLIASVGSAGPKADTSIKVKDTMFVKKLIKPSINQSSN